MTEQELAGLFTPPNPKLAAVRKLLIRILEKEIREANERALAAQKSPHVPVSATEALRDWCNGLSYAQLTLGDALDSDGKILIDTLREAGLSPEEIELLTKN